MCGATGEGPAVLPRGLGPWDSDGKGSCCFGCWANSMYALQIDQGYPGVTEVSQSLLFPWSDRGIIEGPGKPREATL